MSKAKKPLLLLAATMLTMAAFTSSAMGLGGALRDVSNNEYIVNGTKLNLKGWAKFETLGTGIECHVTATFENTFTGVLGTQGNITQLSPNTASCYGFGSIYKGCKVKSDEVQNLPYAAMGTPTDLDVTSTNITITSTLTSCENTKITFTNLFFEEGITLKLLGTGTRLVTNTENKLGNTITTNTSIAGIELEALGEAVNNLGELGVETTGELELTGSGRCTYKLSTS